MKQRIEKTCCSVNSYCRSQKFYKQARLAFGDILDLYGVKKDDKILMPAYIGWSAREGSGVFDPITQREIKPVFYHVNKTLKINIEDCIRKIDTENAKTLLIIHYFGFVDSNAKTIIEYAKNKGLLVIEDAAHALFSDKVGKSCGRDGHFTLYSLHKMLPFSDGGVLVNNGISSDLVSADNDSIFYDYSQYDLSAIAAKRIEIYQMLVNKIEKRGNKHINILYKQLREGIVPQTLPIVLTETDRDAVYSEMNERGWGIVSLYHTMIEQLRVPEFADECWLSKHITNLPVHQDVNKEFVSEMIEDLIMCVEKYRTY